MTLRRSISAALAALMSLAMVFGSSLSASATPSLPSTTQWTSGGLHEMVRFSGPLTTSISGSGSTGTTSFIAVNKPAGATVVAAYLTSAVRSSATTYPAPAVAINNQAVTFTHSAELSFSGGKFYNFFADVTTQIKSTVDAAAAGNMLLRVTEPRNGSYSDEIDGEELVVIFDDPAKASSTSSVVIMFGASRAAGDTFSIGFPAITDLSTQSATLSAGISFSNQSSNLTQSSKIEIASSSNPTFRTVTVTAGGSGDTDDSSSLLTVGGIGNSTNLPNPASPVLNDDDELYGLNSFLAVGDSSIDLKTTNTSNDDNFFQAVLVLEGIAVTGASPLGTQPVSSSPQNNSSPGASGSSSSQLAQTGEPSRLPIALIGLIFLFAGISVYSGSVALKRRATN